MSKHNFKSRAVNNARLSHRTSALPKLWLLSPFRRRSSRHSWLRLLKFDHLEMFLLELQLHYVAPFQAYESRGLASHGDPKPLPMRLSFWECRGEEAVEWVGGFLTSLWPGACVLICHRADYLQSQTEPIYWYLGSVLSSHPDEILNRNILACLAIILKFNISFPNIKLCIGGVHGRGLSECQWVVGGLFLAGLSSAHSWLSV